MANRRVWPPRIRIAVYGLMLLLALLALTGIAAAQGTLIYSAAS
jgi:hypothetical protein